MSAAVQTQTQKDVEAFTQKGLAPDDAHRLSDWVSAGKPGLLSHKADFLGRVFSLGYSCQEIQRWFPQYPIEILLWSRVYYGWDEMRVRHRDMASGGAVEAGVAGRTEGLKLLANIAQATAIDWNKRLMKWAASPDTEKKPDFVPDTLPGMQRLLECISELLLPAGSAQTGQTQLPSGAGAVPLISLTFTGESAASKAVQAVVDGPKKSAVKQAEEPQKGLKAKAAILRKQKKNG